MFRLKANKTSLYKLVGEFEDLPPMRRVTITKAYRTPDWWLKWTDADGLLCVAFFSTCMGKALREITVRDMTDRNAPGVRHLSEAEEETVAILGLLHDVCKVGVYHQTDPFKAAMKGKLATMAPYEFRDPLPLGHGEKSLFLITRHMALTEEEALAIRWHMGAYDDAVKGGSRSMTEAMNMTPWVWRLQEADMCAAWIDERCQRQ